MNNLSSTNTFLNPLNTAHKELQKEFDTNYRNYLTNSLIYDVLLEIVNTNPLKSTETSNSKVATNSQQHQQLDEKIREKFLKSYLISNFNDSNDSDTKRPTSASAASGSGLESDDDFNKKFLNDLKKTEPLDKETKKYLMKKFENLLETRLIEIDDFMTKNQNDDDNNDSNDIDDDNNDFGLDSMKLNDSTSDNNLLNFSSSETKLVNQINNEQQQQQAKINPEQVINKFNDLNESICHLDTDIERTNEDVQVKMDRCLNLLIEMGNLIKQILSEFRIKFYENENRVKCEHKIVECETLLAKMRVVTAELTSDLYTPDKLKALRMIKDQIDLNTQMTTEKYNQISSTLNSFKSLGKEFDSILASYKELKVDLEKKTWTLNKLNEDL